MFCLKIWILFLCGFILLKNVSEGSNSELKFPKSRKGKQFPVTSERPTNKVEVVPAMSEVEKKKSMNEVEKPPTADEIAKMIEKEWVKKIKKIVATTDSNEAEAVFKEFGTTSPKDDIYNLCNPRIKMSQKVNICAYNSNVTNQKYKYIWAECVNHEIKTRSNPKEKGKNIPVLECQNRDGGPTKKVLHRFLVFNTPKKDGFYTTNTLQAGQTGWEIDSIIIYHTLFPEDYLKQDKYKKLPKSTSERREKIQKNRQKFQQK